MEATREAELAALIAEQEADDTHRVWARELSLDAPIIDNADAGSFHEVHGEADSDLAKLLGEDETWLATVKQRRITKEDVAYWRYLRTRQGWSNTRIAEECGVASTTVWNHLGKPKRRSTPRNRALAEKLPLAKSMYAHGARLIDIAESFYAEVGYASAESCYQELRKLFLDKRVPIRPQSWKHGKRSMTATREEYIGYWKSQNRKAREHRRASLRQCMGITKAGIRCSRMAIHHSPFCVTHSYSGRTRTWTYEAVREALRQWTVQHGRPPKPRDWSHATVEHPNFKTVYGLWSSWPAAIEASQATLERKAA